MNIKVGDYIKATRKDDPKMTITDTVRDCYAGGDVMGTVYHLLAEKWNFEVIERPYELPTEPGLYTMTPTGCEEDIVSYRVVRLDQRGLWRERDFTQEEHDKLVKEFHEDKRVLRRLVIEEEK